MVVVRSVFIIVVSEKISCILYFDVVALTFLKKYKSDCFIYVLLPNDGTYICCFTFFFDLMCLDGGDELAL